MNDELKKISLDEQGTDDPNTLLEHWSTQTEKILDEFAPLRACPFRKIKHFTLPPEIIAMINRRKNLASKVKRHPYNKTMISELRMMQRTVKSNITRYLKTQGEITLNSTDLRESWKFIKQVTHTTTRRNKIQADCTELNEYFAGIVNTEKPLHNPLYVSTCKPEYGFCIQDIPARSIVQHILHMKANTSMGDDGLPVSFLKKTALAISPNIAKIFKSSITYGQFPDTWKRANITAIYKGKGSKKDVTNYRPISVLPCLTRVFEREIAIQLSHYCMFNNIIPKEQYGFRPKSCCETALVSALNSWIGDIDD